MNYESYEVRIYENGNKYWFQNGKAHRLDGPAIERTDGDKHWLQNGLLHRLDGPAIEWANGDKSYWIEGEYYYYNDWKQKVNELKNPVKELTVSEVSKLLGYQIKIARK